MPIGAVPKGAVPLPIGGTTPEAEGDGARLYVGKPDYVDVSRKSQTGYRSTLTPAGKREEPEADNSRLSRGTAAT